VLGRLLFSVGVPDLAKQALNWSAWVGGVRGTAAGRGGDPDDFEEGGHSEAADARGLAGTALLSG
jgi:hypothetical protein